MLLEKAVKQIQYELEEIENLFQLYNEELFEIKGEPGIVELTAFASVLHSFYYGIEKIFLIIAREINRNVPYDMNWHKSLLLQMTKNYDNRPPVISENLKEKLLKYLSFRHFYRHSYSSRLKWRRS